MIRSALFTGAPRPFMFKSSSTSHTSGLRPGPNNGQAAIAIARNVLREVQSSVNHQGMEKTLSPVASSGALGCVLANGRSPVMNTLKNFHLEPHKCEGLTVDEYHELIESGFLDHVRGELIDGFFIQMHPQCVEHVATLSFLFRTLFKDLENRAVIRDSKPITLMKLKSEPEPDIVIASGVDDDYNTRNPSPSDVLLVAKVSNSTLKKDSTIKLEEYALTGIPEYWIVDIKARNVQVLRKPQGNCYESKVTVSSGFIAPAAFPDVSIRVQTLFRS
ncbi:hypothetical protein BWQ96_00212 [Gracilariopsis chorda]|uniref:Putative restriction endonuclease domain-containing protein n=1 Tax=Gracilariopsis chorda TaxID=448386 RepID=A0A2V3J7S8_9FLOR|nr:hypothetical protein BWQ96_00212 [Gracilariopsis chorda]|eukprot:PXF50052.1 hypothetical protein BWQ96_00212 [Gracilariopsis chorda]